MIVLVSRGWVARGAKLGRKLRRASDPSLLLVRAVVVVLSPVAERTVRVGFVVFEMGGLAC